MLCDWPKSEKARITMVFAQMMDLAAVDDRKFPWISDLQAELIADYAPTVSAAARQIPDRGRPAASAR
jgi:hypothetical protein